MAKCTVKMPDDFTKKITTLGNKTDELLSNVLEAGGEVVVKEVKNNLMAVIGTATKKESRSTGELLNSLGVSPVLVDYDGNSNIKVGFSEPRRQQSTKKGHRSYNESTNAMIANVLEYGKHGQAPKPFLKPAKVRSRTPCKKAMIQKLEEEIQHVK